mgnify:CR=1 FL=1
MKIPKYTSTTRMGTEPGNVSLQIQQDPNASSLGARSQIGFGQSVTELGKQVFTLGARLQEIKNNTEASRINNEYTKAVAEIDSFVPQAPFGFDVEMWAKTEKAKVKNALLKGQAYQVNYPVGSIRDPQDGYSGNVYNMVSDGSGGSIPNAIVKNNAVKKAVATSFAQTDVKSEVAIQGALATKLYNEKIALKDETVENLEEAFINTMDMDYYYDLFGSEEVKDENGNILVAGRNGIFMDSLELYNNDEGLRGMFTDREESQGRIADALVTKLDTSIRLSAMNYDDPADFKKAYEGIEDLRKSLEQKAPDGSYPFLPDVKGLKRQELINKLITAQGESTKKIADVLENESAIFEKTRSNTSNKKVLTYTKEFEPFMENSSIFDPSNEDAKDLRAKFDLLDNQIRQDYNDAFLTKEHKDDLLDIHQRIRSGDIIPSSIVSLTNAQELITSAFDEEDLRIVKEKIGGNIDLNGKDRLTLFKQIDNLILNTPSAQFQKELVGRLKGFTGFDLGIDMMGMPNGDKLTSGLIVNSFIERTNEDLITGKSIEKKDMIQAYNEAVESFVQANKNSLNSLLLLADDETMTMNPYSAFALSRETMTKLSSIAGNDNNLKYPDINTGSGMIDAYKTHKDALFVDMKTSIEGSELSNEDKEAEYRKLNNLKFLIKNSSMEDFTIQ